MLFHAFTVMQIRPLKRFQPVQVPLDHSTGGQSINIMNMRPKNCIDGACIGLRIAPRDSRHGDPQRLPPSTVSPWRSRKVRVSTSAVRALSHPRKCVAMPPPATRHVNSTTRAHHPSLLMRTLSPRERCPGFIPSEFARRLLISTV